MQKEPTVNAFDIPTDNPAARVLHAVRRPECMTGLGREFAASAVTAGLWPFGVADRGVSELRRRFHLENGTQQTPVLMVHGYGANKSNWALMSRRLRAAGFANLHALNYNPVLKDIPAVSADCVRRARALMDASGSDRIHLVGHSTGGVVIRHAVQLGGLVEAATVATVAAPHGGAFLARFALGSTARQLRPGSALLSAISAAPAPPQTRFVAYYSNADVIVPGWSARMVEPQLHASNHLMKDQGHLSILLSKALLASLVEELLRSEGRLVHLPKNDVAAFPSLAAAAS